LPCFPFPHCNALSWPFNMYKPAFPASSHVLPHPTRAYLVPQTGFHCGTPSPRRRPTHNPPDCVSTQHPSRPYGLPTLMRRSWMEGASSRRVGSRILRDCTAPRGLLLASGLPAVRPVELLPVLLQLPMHDCDSCVLGTQHEPHVARLLFAHASTDRPE